MLGWLYMVGVLLAVAVVVYLDRGSIGRGQIDIRESAPSSWAQDDDAQPESGRSADARPGVSIQG